jgi:RNA polymerase sigma-70 factor (ECF subfamily)
VDHPQILGRLFATLLEKNYLKDVAPHKGKFRSFLLASIAHYLSNERDRANAKKRGGDFNFVEAETRIAAADPAPEKAFLKEWALEVLQRAMARLRETCPPEEISLLSGIAPPGMSESDRKNRGHRLRRLLRECVREEIRPSVTSESDLEEELQELFAALS